MSYETIETKKFLNANGVGHLWEKIRERFDSKLDSVVAQNDSIVITNGDHIGVQISAEEGNALQLRTTGNKGLYVSASAALDTYTITKLGTPSTGAAASYKLQMYSGGSGAPVDVGATIDIPKDMVVSSGTVETKSESGVWGEAGTYIHLVLANADNQDLYINVGNLIEYVTSGSQVGDMIFINIDAQHRVTATITDGSITKAKLAQSVQNSLDAADSAIQSVVEGTTNGTISVDGTDIGVHGLGSAAFTDSTDYDAAGAAALVLGTSSDGSSVATVYGIKQYASDVYASIQALTNAEIDEVIVSTNGTIDT